MVMKNVAVMTMLIAALPLAAHHSTRAEFDDSRIVTMSGTVREVTWMNPHANLLVTVTDPAGDVPGNAAEWRIELPSPNSLVRQGWKREDLKAGDRVTMGLWLAKDGSKTAAMRMITFPDGRVISGVSSWDNPIKLQ